MITRRGLVAGLCALSAGCGASLRRFPFDQSQVLSTHLGIELHHFSVSCVWLRWRGGSVLFDPFFTHLPLRTVTLGHCLSDPDALAGREHMFADTRAVLVGHSHYDHVMGLSLVDPLLPEDSVVLGSKTLAHTYAAADLTHPVVPLNGQLANPERIGAWWTHPSGTLRVLPIVSGHPSQWLCFHLFRKALDRDRSGPPTRASHYQEGVTMAFLVDLMDGPRVQARVYVQSSSTGPPAGFMPAQILAERPVDVAILAMDVANREQRHGDSVLHLLDAPVVFFNHFEDFFRNKDKAPREIVKVDLPRSRDFFNEQRHRRTIFSAYDQRYRL